VTDCTERHLPALFHGLDREGQKGTAKEALL
jgi:hypothetical protein